MATGGLDLRFYFCMESKGSKCVIEWCMEVGMLSKSYECPVCKCLMKLVERKDAKDGYEWMCRARGSNPHKSRRSLRKGSWFENGHLPMSTLLIMTHMFIHKCSHDFIHSELHMAKQTITDWLCFCREMCLEICVRESVLVGGVGVIVEIDECKFSKRKYNRGKKVEGQWVFGGVERDSNKYFFAVVENKSASVLVDVIHKNVCPGSIVMSDCWKKYSLSNVGFSHLKVNNNLTFKDLHTNLNGSAWNTIKRSLRGTRHIEDYFDGHLAEYMWRRFHNQSTGALIKSFHDAIIAVYPPQVRDDDE